MPPTEEDLSLEAELGAALDAQEGATPAKEEIVEQPQAKPKDAAFPKSEEMPPKREYVREGRRFVAKDGEGEPTKAKEGEPAKSASEEKPDPTAPVKTWKPLWYKDEYGPWDKLSEPFRNALREQERSYAKGIEERTAQVKGWEPINQLLAPHDAELKAAGLTKEQYVGNLINADKYLRTNPEQAMNWLCQQYLGTDIFGLADHMQANGAQPAAPADPMKRELEALKQRLTNYEKSGQDAAAKAQREALETQIQTWAADKPHFEDVREYMASLARVPANKGASLDQLYESALLAHPQLRQRILEDKRRDEVQRARAAGATSPRSSPVNGAQRIRPTLSLEEEIGSLYDGQTV